MQKFLNVFTTPKGTTHHGTVELIRLIEAEGNLKVETFNYAFLKPQGKVEPHTHTDSVEYYLILSGTGKIYLDQETEDLKRGDFIKIDLQIEHSLENIGSETLEFISLRAKTNTI